jgi:hypothetical protein
MLHRAISMSSFRRTLLPLESKNWKCSTGEERNINWQKTENYRSGNNSLRDAKAAS